MIKSAAEIALGPMLIGTAFNLVLYGIMITQVNVYFSTYPKDRAWFKGLVSYLFIADTVNVVFDLVYLYQSLILHFGDAEYLTTANWIFATDPAMTGIIASSVQCFFAWRIKVITSSTLATIVVAIGGFIGLSASIGTSIAVGIVPTFTEFVRFEVIVIIWLVGAAITDLCIAFALCYHLQTHKTGFSSTDDVINKIIRLTVQTGAITAIWAIIDLIVYLVDSSGTHLIFNVPLSKLYTNSLMSSLNSRRGWNFGGPSGNASSGGVITRRPSHAADLGPRTTSRRQEIFVHVDHHEMFHIEGKHSDEDAKIWSNSDATDEVSHVV